MNALIEIALAGLLTLQMPTVVVAQQPPSPRQIAAYDGLFKAAFEGNLEDLRQLLQAETQLEIRDGNGRTPLHVAAHASMKMSSKP